MQGRRGQGRAGEGSGGQGRAGDGRGGDSGERKHLSFLLLCFPYRFLQSIADSFSLKDSELRCEVRKFVAKFGSSLRRTKIRWEDRKVHFIIHNPVCKQSL